MSTSSRILFPVAVDAQALQDHPTERDRIIHHAVTSALQSHGILTIGDGDAEALFDAIAAIGSDSQALWVQLLKALDKWDRIDRRSRTASVTDVLNGLSELKDFGEIVRLIVAGEDAAKQHGVSASTKCRTVNGSDVVVAASVDRSTAIESAGRVGRFPKGTEREEIAETLLRPLGARSTHVRVLDPQMLETFITDGKHPPHVQWLLQTLAASMPPMSTISIIGTLQNTWVRSNKESQEDRIRQLIETLLTGRTKPLTVRVTLVQSARTPLQNRYAWFSCGPSYDVLHNFAPLGSDQLKTELRFLRQDLDFARDTMQLAEAYETCKLPGMISVTVDLPIESKE